MRRRTPPGGTSGSPTPVEPEEVVVIDDLGGLGDGVVRRGDGSVLFVPGALAGERARVAREGDRRRLVEVLEASPDRREPPCPHYGACGGCALQHLSDDAYRRFKRSALQAELERGGLAPEVLEGFHAEPGARRRLALHARKRDGVVTLGLKGRRSWTVVSLSVCPVAVPSIIRALPDLRDVASLCLLSPKSAPILHVTATDAGLDVEITGVDGRRGLTADDRGQAAARAHAGGLARLTLEGEVLYQARRPQVAFGGVTVDVPPGGFLQASREAEAFMAEAVVAAAGDGRRLLDLFCGAGAFTFPLARRAPVVGYDAAPAAIAALNLAARRSSGLKPVRAEVRDLLRRPLTPVELRRFDVVTLDPPRGGALEQCRAIAEADADLRTVVYVSCNPATFVRDAAALQAGGFALETVTPVDQFLWSPHMELVGVFHRKVATA